MSNLILVFSCIFSSFISYAQEAKKLTVYFKYDKYELDSTSRTTLDSSLQDQVISQIHIEAHCDSFGTLAYNDLLSLKRALEIKKYFVSKKVTETPIDIKALGKRAPLNNNGPQALNRRAEITVFSKILKTTKKDSLVNIKDSVSTSSSKNTMGIDIKNATIGESYKIKNLNFYGGSHKLLPQSKPTLEMLLTTLKENPNLEIQIQGYICCLQQDVDGFDSETYTKNLSVNRAKAVYDYLVKNGIDSVRLSYVGFGSSHKLVEEITEEDRSINRRVEIKIIKK